MFQCPCGVSLRYDPKPPFYCKCGRIDGQLREVYQPAWLPAIKRLAKPADRGVGDTIHRIASWLGGELFKALAKKLGIPCGCTRRQAEWNARWPY